MKQERVSRDDVTVWRKQITYWIKKQTVYHKNHILVCLFFPCNSRMWYFLWQRIVKQNTCFFFIRILHTKNKELQRAKEKCLRLPKNSRLTLLKAPNNAFNSTSSLQFSLKLTVEKTLRIYTWPSFSINTVYEKFVLITK